MIKENKNQLIISSILILLPMLWGIYIIPVIMLLSFWLCVVITAKDTKNKEQNPKILTIVFFIMPILSLVLNGLFLLCADTKFSGVDVTSVTLSLMGLMFIVIGNYLPKIKQNNTIGIKINWTLKNEENWNVTHRFAGKLWFAGGVIMLSTMFMKQGFAIAIFFIDMIIMVVWPIIYSYNYHKKQLANGAIDKEDFVLTKKEKKMNMIGVIIIVAIAIVAFMGDYSIKVNANTITIDAKLWSDTEIDISDIESVELKATDNIGQRTFGYGTPKLYMGEFMSSEYGDYIRYSRGDVDMNIVIKTKDETYVINEKTENLTRKIYDEIRDIVN